MAEWLVQEMGVPEREGREWLCALAGTSVSDSEEEAKRGDWTDEERGHAFPLEFDDEGSPRWDELQLCDEKRHENGWALEGLGLRGTTKDDLAIASFYGPAQGFDAWVAEVADGVFARRSGHETSCLSNRRDWTSRKITFRRVPRVHASGVRITSIYKFGRHYAMRNGNQGTKSLSDRYATGYEQRQTPRIIRWHRVVEGRKMLRQAVRVQEKADESPENNCLHQ